MGRGALDLSYDLPIGAIRPYARKPSLAFDMGDVVVDLRRAVQHKPGAAVRAQHMAMG